MKPITFLFGVWVVLFASGCTKFSMSSMGRDTINECVRPIRNGDENASAYDYVLKLYIEVNGSLSLCSGTVISPHVVLTAGHCVRYVPANSPAGVRAQLNNGQWVFADAITVHPDYSGYAELQDSFLVPEGKVYVGSPDLALVRFPQDLGVTPRQLHTESLNAGETMTMVGFGRDENEVNDIRRFGSATFVGAHSTYDGSVADANLIVVPNTSNAIACPGDSGGPGLVGGKVAGVFALFIRVGSGSDICQSVRSNTYLSMAAFGQWVEQERDILDPNDGSGDDDNDDGSVTAPICP